MGKVMFGSWSRGSMAAPTASAPARWYASAWRDSAGTRVARRRLTLDNTVAGGIGGLGGLRAFELEGAVDCELRLRGNVLTLDGEEGEVRRRRRRLSRSSWI